EARASFLAQLGGDESDTDLTDGVRMTLTDGRIVHVRASGNAPELRLYVEASDKAGAEALMTEGLAALHRAVLG
ncbi:MAG: phosphomannomutase, partial [Pelagibaca sp.]|nr:phosphomannomutase [Pelagibaca sp.]